MFRVTKRITSKKQLNDIRELEKTLSDFSYGNNEYYHICLPDENRIVLHPKANCIGNYFGTRFGSPIIDITLKNNDSTVREATKNDICVKYRTLSFFKVARLIVTLFCLIIQTVVLMKVSISQITWEAYLPMLVCVFVHIAFKIMFVLNCFMAHSELKDIFD